MNGSRHKVGSIGDLQPGLNSIIFMSEVLLAVFAQANLLLWSFRHSFLVQVVVFRLPETFNFVATDGRCKQVHHSHAFDSVQMFTVVHSLHEFTRYMFGSRLRFTLKQSFHLSRHVSRHDTRNTQHVFLILFFCSRSCTTAKVDHIHRFERTTRG